MSDKQSIEDVKCGGDFEQVDELDAGDITENACAPGCSGASYSDAQATTSSMGGNNKSIQIDMDCEPGDDPKKNKKYWQDVAGLRGAREQYLQLDIRDLGAEQSRQSDYINYLKAKLDRAIREIMELKSKRCRCEEEEEQLDIFSNKQFSSMGL